MGNPNESEIPLTYESDVPEKKKIVVQKFIVDGEEKKHIP